MKQQIRGHIQHLNWAPNAERQKLKSASSRGRPDFAGLWGRRTITVQRHMPKPDADGSQSRVWGDRG